MVPTCTLFVCFLDSIPILYLSIYKMFFVVLLYVDISTMARLSLLLVTISVDYTAPPDFPFPPGSNEYRAGSGPLIFTCRVSGAVATGVTWTTTCNCPVAGSTANPIRRGAITSGDTGTHTCTVSGESSESVTVNIVGKCP